MVGQIPAILGHPGLVIQSRTGMELQSPILLEERHLGPVLPKNLKLHHLAGHMPLKLHAEISQLKGTDLRGRREEGERSIEVN